MKSAGLRTIKLVVMSIGIVLSFVLSACSTVPQSQALRQVRVGMTKAEVLDLVGNPTRTERRHGQDRWTYESPPHSGDGPMYIFFSEGQVTYVGDAKAPGPVETPDTAGPTPTPTGRNSSAGAATAEPADGGFRPVDGESH